MANKNKEAQRRARQRQKQLRALAFIIVGVGVLSLAGYFLASAFFRPPPPPMAGNVIDVSASMSGFDMKLIRVIVR